MENHKEALALFSCSDTGRLRPSWAEGGVCVALNTCVGTALP